MQVRLVGDAAVLRIPGRGAIQRCDRAQCGYPIGRACCGKSVQMDREEFERLGRDGTIKLVILEDETPAATGSDSPAEAPTETPADEEAEPEAEATEERED